MSRVRQLIDETTADVVPVLAVNPKLQQRKKAWWQRDERRKETVESLVSALIEDEDEGETSSHSLIPDDAKEKFAGASGQEDPEDSVEKDPSRPSVPDFNPISPSQILVAPDATPGANRPIDPKHVPSPDRDQEDPDSDRDRVMSLFLGKRDPTQGPPGGIKSTPGQGEGGMPEPKSETQTLPASQEEIRKKMFEAMGYQPPHQEAQSLAEEAPAFQPSLEETVAAATVQGQGMPAPVSKAGVAASVNRFRRFTG